MRGIWLVALVGCGDNQLGKTPEQVIGGAKDGQVVEAIGEVHAVTFDSVMSQARKLFLAQHGNAIDDVLEQGDEESIAFGAPFGEQPGAGYARTGDHYILIRSVPIQGDTLDDQWGLGIHLGDIDPADPMPELGSIVDVTGTFQHITWNQREEQVPVLENATITIVSGPAPLAGPGDACAIDQDCNARLICDRTNKICGAPPREIYWDDPFHDVNGACDTDADCPLGQTCDPSYAIATSGEFAAHYFVSTDTGRHVCAIPAALHTVAAQCPRIYTMRDVVGARFVTGKEICVRATLLSPVHAEDGDTHDQMIVDEPGPYPTADIGFGLFGGTTENGPPYKNPAAPGGGIADPAVGDDVIAVGTFRYDPGHGWHEVHPVKAYFHP
jgi:hypothetical protein